MSEGNHTYYWINQDGTVNSATSIYNYGEGHRYLKPDRFIAAKKVWRQGPRGGVQLIKTPWLPDCDEGWNYIGYITNNPEAMREFSWAVLAAQPLNIRI